MLAIIVKKFYSFIQRLNYFSDIFFQWSASNPAKPLPNGNSPLTHVPDAILGLIFEQLSLKRKDYLPLCLVNKRFNQYVKDKIIKKGIFEKQQWEIDHLTKHAKEILGKVSFEPQVKKKLEDAFAKLSRLPQCENTVEARHQLLDYINEQMIRSKMIPTFCFHFSHMFLTRFPIAILKDPFWNSVVFIEVSHNFLREIPEELWQLPKLKEIKADDNCFQTTPTAKYGKKLWVDERFKQIRCRHKLYL